MAAGAIFDELTKALNERIMFFDGAMGTMIQKRQLQASDFHGPFPPSAHIVGDEFKDHAKPLQGNNDMLVLTRPDVILDIHLQYLGAGADFVETNTFNSTRIAQADYGTEHLVRARAGSYARCTASTPRPPSWLARPASRCRRRTAAAATLQVCFNITLMTGAIGPTNRTLSISPSVLHPDHRNVTFEELVQAYGDQVPKFLARLRT